MDDWYTIGVTLGLGLGFGVILSGLLAANAVGTGVAVALGVAAGAVVGYLIGDTAETIAGIVGGLVGALAAAVVVLGAMRRGATRLGVGTYVGAVGVLILMVSLWIHRPLEFSAFPTVLLIATMLRLSLNVATTRLILSNGAEGYDAAGHVIAGFANFVMGGDFVIGTVVFVILITVNFLVITTGASRIAEVGARFSLDALPGKQMAIDADLSAGLLDEKEAMRRRRELEEESAFYGATGWNRDNSYSTLNATSDALLHFATPRGLRDLRRARGEAGDGPQDVPPVSRLRAGALDQLGEPGEHPGGVRWAVGHL